MRQHAGLEVLVGISAPLEVAPAPVGQPAFDGGANSAILEIPAVGGAEQARRRARGTASAPRSGVWRAASKSPWPLLIILAVQAALSLRLIWANTTFQDEALYLWAGHVEWSHWLYGASIPDFANYFSGAPVLYPPLAAIADTYGGLAGARLLSLVFMLGSTAFLYGTGRRIFGERAALFAAGLFVAVASVQFLGAFATYDAMALFLLSLAAWLGVRAVQTNLASQIFVFTLVGLVLALADATKYAATLFDPVVIAVVVLAQRNWRKVWLAASVITAATMLAIAVGLSIGGPSYWHGITWTTLARSTGTTSPAGVLFASGKWVGAVIALALIGAIAASFSEGSRTKLLAWSLAIATILAPIEQARIHTITSLFKHVGYGAWFGCIIAGYALSALAKVVAAGKIRTALRVSTATVLMTFVPGIMLVSKNYTAWPSSGAYVSAIARAMRDSGDADDPVLVDQASIANYYLHGALGFDNAYQTWYFAYTDPKTGQRITAPAEAFADAIKNGYFELVALVYGSGGSTYDVQIRKDIMKYKDYRLIASIPYKTSANSGRFLVWVRSSDSILTGGGHK